MIINLISDLNSWFKPYLENIQKEISARGHIVNSIHKPEDIIKGDVLFSLSYYKLIKKDFFSLNKNNIVIHESDLPLGKGWSPLSWQILEGKNEIVFSLFEMDEKVDNGAIFFKETLVLQGHELNDELKHMQAVKKIQMCLKFLDNYNKFVGKALKQSGKESFYLKRTKESSELDINKTIEEQFNLLRIVDNVNYPAFFVLNGYKYKLTIEKINN